MTPLRVTFHLASAVVEGDYPIHLDDLIAWATVDEKLQGARPDDPSLSDAQYEALIADLPLSKLEGADGQSVWAASQISFDKPEGRGMRMFVRRTDTDTLSQLVGDGQVIRRGDQINLATGPDKNYLLQIPFITVGTATAWCIGEKVAIERLLARVHYLGKKRSQGFGRVLSVSVDEAPEAAERVWVRHLPWPRDGYHPARVAVRPPYWSPKNEVDAWIPD